MGSSQFLGGPLTTLTLNGTYIHVLISWLLCYRDANHYDLSVFYTNFYHFAPLRPVCIKLRISLWSEKKKKKFGPHLCPVIPNYSITHTVSVYNTRALIGSIERTGSFSTNENAWFKSAYLHTEKSFKNGASI